MIETTDFSNVMSIASVPLGQSELWVQVSYDQNSERA